MSGRVIAAALASAIALSGCGATHRQFGLPRTGGVPGEAGQNVVRITGLGGDDVAGAASLALYPGGERSPGGWLIFNRGRWRDAVLAAQFAAAPLDASLLPVASKFLPTPAKDLINRVLPVGFPQSQGIQTLMLGDQPTDVLSAVSDRKLKASELKAPTPPELASKLVPYRGGFAHAYSGEIVIVSQQDPAYALPAAAWSAYSGDTIGFVDRNGVPAATVAMLTQREKLKAEKPTVYLLGPPSVISDGVAKQLGQYGAVKRIAGPDAVTTAIAFAQYRDPKTGFGWGLTRGPASVSLVNVNYWQDAIGAFMFAAAGPQAPLLLTTSAGALPAPVASYLAQLRVAQGNQGFVFGDPQRISSVELQQLDASLAGGGLVAP